MESGFKIPYSILKDRYNGLGCFSNEDIKTDTLVWKFDDANICIWKMDYCKELFKTFDEKTLMDVLTYNFYMNDCMVDIRFDDGKYINHSSDPNILCGYEINKKFGFEKYKKDELFNSYAVKDIPKGTEILDDYNTYGDTPFWIVEIEKRMNINNDYLG